jgi:dipeptidyl aminopeptidase/acylaminoacyl peptidase
MKQRKAFGLWDSPISPEMIGDSIRLNDVQWDTDNETLVWSERRENRTVLVAKKGADTMRDLTDSRFSPAGRILYGGGEFTVYKGNVYFVDGGRLYKLSLSGGGPKAISPKFGGAAAPSVSPDGKWIAFAHTYEDKDVLALVDSEGGFWPQKLAWGSDFYMQPTWSPDGQKIAYVTWNHPNMAWNSSELRLITLSMDGRGMPYPATEETLVSGNDVAVFQPEFSPDGKYLAYASDASGWWHLYLYDFETQQHQQLTEGEIEHAVPAWVQGLRSFAWSSDSQCLYSLRHERGLYSLWRYDLAQGAAQEITALSDYTSFERLSLSPSGDKLALVASSVNTPSRLITYSESEGLQLIRRTSSESLESDALAPCEVISWRGHDGDTAHGLFFPPTNPEFEGIGKPPLIILVHGGPTSQRNLAFDMEVQFFTSRGFAVMQLNHRGSTGFGKAYMNKHKGNWGVYDVQDSVTGARYLIDRGLVDSDKLVIMGGSAGGYTAWQALVDAPNFFKAAVISYGVANQFTLAMETHKFEERYSDWLLGALPEASALYRERSPIFYADKIQDAVIVFQGADDVVVPKNQSDTMVAVLKRRGIPHEYIVYEGEGHGFRKPETKVDFYNKVIRFLKLHVLYT